MEYSMSTIDMSTTDMSNKCSWMPSLSTHDATVGFHNLLHARSIGVSSCRPIEEANGFWDMGAGSAACPNQGS